MKVYIVIEGDTIRSATLRRNIAEQIVQAFSYLALTIIEIDLMGMEDES